MQRLSSRELLVLARRTTQRVRKDASTTGKHLGLCNSCDPKTHTAYARAHTETSTLYYRVKPTFEQILAAFRA